MKLASFIRPKYVQTDYNALFKIIHEIYVLLLAWTIYILVNAIFQIYQFIINKHLCDYNHDTESPKINAELLLNENKSSRARVKLFFI